MERTRSATATVFLVFQIIGLPWKPGNASLINDISGYQADPCQNDDGSPRRCVADFVNAAFTRRVVASSTCGSPPSRHCPPTTTPKTSPHSRTLIDTCFVCNSSQVGLNHPATFLTDLNNPSNVTCWTSALDPGLVTLTASLEKKYEITYVSLQFCSVPPPSVTILKSTDNGRTWTPMQYYSNQCRRNYGKAPRTLITKTHEQEAICSEVTVTESNTRIAFVTLEGRPSAQDFENSPTLQDFVTATDIKVELGLPVREERSGVEPKQSKDRIYYSLADLAIGGRCKCNGHAHRCVTGRDGKVQCECKHNTGGVDCQLCRPFHYDRPWTRATEANPTGCTACSCNLHSKHCRFNMELFRSSGDRSGGVCLKCRHSTTGKNCHLCLEGHYRNTGKPITHRKACQACECHPVGSLGKNCNQTDGQCHCKDGVTGRQCTQCTPGYQQTTSPVAPCIKVATAGVSSQKNNATKATKADQCNACKTKWRSVNVADYCSSDYVIQVKVKSLQVSSVDRQKVTVAILKVFKDIKSLSSRGRVLDLWLPGAKSTGCQCHHMRIKTTYLLFGRTVNDRGGISIDHRKTLAVVNWKDGMTNKLKKFSKSDC